MEIVLNVTNNIVNKKNINPYLFLLPLSLSLPFVTDPWPVSPLLFSLLLPSHLLHPWNPILYKITSIKGQNQSKLFSFFFFFKKKKICDLQITLKKSLFLLVSNHSNFKYFKSDILSQLYEWYNVLREYFCN